MKDQELSKDQKEFEDEFGPLRDAVIVTMLERLTENKERGGGDAAARMIVTDFQNWLELEIEKRKLEKDRDHTQWPE
jgi:hypothetical protein